MSDCQTCLPIANCLSEDIDLYSLQTSFPFVTRCPSGLNCNAEELHMDCCGTELSVSFPIGVSIAQRNAIINILVAECARRLMFCGRIIIPPPNGTLPPPVFYYSAARTGSSQCPDGNTFIYTVRAGTFLALTQEEANQAAQIYAGQQAALHRICLSYLFPFACKDNAYEKRITATGNFLASPPLQNFWELTAGSLPPGLGIVLGYTVQKFVTITGTPITAGVYNFTIKITAPNGDNMRKSYQLTVAEILPGSALPGFLPGIPYSQNLTVTPAHDQETESWSVISGDLPPGFELTTAGVLHGTTEDTDVSYAFAVQVTFKPTGSDSYLQCTQDFTISAAIPQPISFWQLEETSGNRKDLMLNRNDLTQVNGVVGSGAGHLGTAYQQSATLASHVAKSGSTSLLLNSSKDITVCGWFYHPPAIANAQFFSWIFKDAASTDLWAVTFSIVTTVVPPAPPTIYATISNSVLFTDYNITLDPIPYQNAQNFFRVWYSTSDNKLRLQINNGTKLEVAVGFTPTSGVTATFEIGRGTAGFRVDEVGAWDQILTDDQVDNLFSAGINGMEIPATATTGFDGSFVDITWSTAQTNAGSEFKVFRNGTEIATVAAGINTYHDATVQSGQTYSYVVRFYTS